MDYTELFHSLHPGFFQEEGIRSMPGDRIVSFCDLADMGRVGNLHIGGPGCVGTIPEFRGQGIGLEMVRQATETLRQDGFDLSWIHYTHLAHWYMKLGYQPVLRWNSGGILRNATED